MNKLLAVAAALSLAAPALAQTADTIYVNGTVHTADDALPTAAAFAVLGDTIVAVGSTDDMAAHWGTSTVLIDLAGKTVLPGLIDAHAHLAGLGALSLGVVDLSWTTSYEQVVQVIIDRAATEPAGTWIIGRGWDHESWDSKELPHHRELSDAVPDHPVWISRVDGHAALANSAAMQAAGIDAATESPAGGEIMTADDGEPTGIFVDNAESVIARVIPASSYPDLTEMILAGQEACLAAGLTGMHDMGISPAQAALYHAMESDGRLVMRVNALISAASAIEYFNEHGLYLGDRLQIRGAKLYMDGAMGSRGAWLLEPYADRPTGSDGQPWVGLALTDPDEIIKVAAHAIRTGYQICAHAIGDRGNREVLDAYLKAEFLGTNGVRPTDAPEPTRLADARFRIEHAQLLSPQDIPRFASLGIIPSMQPTHCTSDMRWVEARVGAERAKGAYAWRSLIDSGVIIAGGSDFPVESHNPFLGFYAAVTRQNADAQPEGGWQPEQRMTRVEALKSFTIWAAHAAFMEDRIGSLTPGKRADFIIIDRDIMACEPIEILGTKVLKTVVSGETVYEAP